MLKVVFRLSKSCFSEHVLSFLVGRSRRSAGLLIGRAACNKRPLLVTSFTTTWASSHKQSRALLKNELLQISFLCSCFPTLLLFLLNIKSRHRSPLSLSCYPPFPFFLSHLLFFICLKSCVQELKRNNSTF